MTERGRRVEMDRDKKCHVMIDVETYSTSSIGVVRTLAAVLFNLSGKYDTLIDYGLDIEEQLLNGLIVDQSTINFWREQPEELRSALVQKTQSPLADVLISLRDTVTAYTDSGTTIYLWSHGSNFDTVILSNLYKIKGIKPFWEYKNVRDTRTLFDLAGYEYKAKGGHNALEDARSQVVAVCEAYNKLFNTTKEG